MSTAGSGDVLSGIITGLLGYIENEFDATCAAAFVNAWQENSQREMKGKYQ